MVPFMDPNFPILAKLEESKISNDDRVEDIETEDTLTDNLKLLNKENISNVLGMHLKMIFIVILLTQCRDSQHQFQKIKVHCFDNF